MWSYFRKIHFSFERPFPAAWLCWNSSIKKSCSVDNYHDPCLHPSFESTGLLNRQIKPAGSGRWNKVSAWISNFIRGKKRHVDIKREGMNLYAHPPRHDWICRKISWEQAPALLHGPSPAMQCWAAAAGCWRQIPLLLHSCTKAFLHLRRTSPSACCWCPPPSPTLWCLVFDGFFENCWAVFGNIVIHGRPCFLQVGAPLWFCLVNLQFFRE